LGSFLTNAADMKKSVLWITRQSAFAQEVAEDNESNQTPFVGVNMRGYYTNIPQERDFKVPIPPNYYEQPTQGSTLYATFFSGYLMKEIRFLL
jgi:hypothetical protein